MENNEVSKSNKIKIIVITALIFLVSIAGISYAYFTIQIVGNDTASSMRLRTANMSLVYNDVQIVSGEYVEPGWTQTKTLTVTNTGNVTAKYNIIWRDLINEIISNELVISATCSASSGTCDDIDETIVPTYTSEMHNITVKAGISIAPGVTHTYTLTAEFKETGSNQNYNQNKYFNGTLNIAEPARIVRRETSPTSVVPGLPEVTIGTEIFYDLTDAIDYSSLDSTFKTKINYDASKSILLAKYNLYVGQTCTSSSSCTPIDTSDSRYGLQSADAGGYGSSFPATAVIPFSGSSNSFGYWDPNNSGINSIYGTYTNYANNIYDTMYASGPDYSAPIKNSTGNVNYSIAYYVKEYVNRLGVDGEGRLLTYPEANTMTPTQRSYNGRFWLGSSQNSYYVWYNYHDGTLNRTNFGTIYANGVRPVIVVNTSDIQSS